MTIEFITNQLDRISADSWYEVTDNHIDLTIDDFDGFDEDWNDDESKADYIYYSSISQYDYDD